MLPVWVGIHVLCDSCPGQLGAGYSAYWEAQEARRAAALLWVIDKEDDLKVSGALPPTASRVNKALKRQHSVQSLDHGDGLTKLTHVIKCIELNTYRHTHAHIAK